MASTPAAGGHNKDRNRLLQKFRKWHSWGGLLLSVSLLLVAATGLLLNHKDLVFHRGAAAKGPTGLLTSATDVATLPVGFDRALELARGHFGDVALEKIELKDERGTLVYRISRGEGDEVRVDATTGALTSKYGMALGENAPGGKGSVQWAKVVDDLHTGKFFGGFGRLLVDVTSLAIIALTLTGIYLWGVPLLRKREGARRRAATPTRDTPPATPRPRPKPEPAPASAAP